MDGLQAAVATLLAMPILSILSDRTVILCSTSFPELERLHLDQVHKMRLPIL